MRGGPDFDPAKDAINIAKHGLSLRDFSGFETGGVARLDSRFGYGEDRYRAFGRIGGQGYCVAFTVRDGRVRLISFRRAHDKEMKRYE